MGNGKRLRDDPLENGGWAPLEAGEFILGYRDETQAYPLSPVPRLLGKNGTFMVYRKLHQNTQSFANYLDEQGAQYAASVSPNERHDAREEVAAKLVGRWRNGAPLVTFPQARDARRFGDQWQSTIEKLFHNPSEDPGEIERLKEQYSALKLQRRNFNYDQDQQGAACPFGSHTRRAYTRGSLDFGVEEAFKTPTALDDRRRLLRRGLPYGDSAQSPEDSGDHGIIFMSLGTSIARQFEFVQQQWMNYGNDFRLGNEKDPIVGNHGPADSETAGRMMINRESSLGKPPHLCTAMPRFVETRGGDYFFLPSITALKLLAAGEVDPT